MKGSVLYMSLNRKRSNAIKGKVGRPKLADKNLTKQSIIMIFLMFLILTSLLYSFSVGLGLNVKADKLVGAASNSSKNKIHFINTGSSDSILIESKGNYCLVDSANPYNDGTSQSISVENDTVRHVIKYLRKVGVKYLDCVIATHAHSDHIGGMVEIANNFANKKTKYYYKKYVKNTDDVNSPSWDNIGYYSRAVNAMKSKGATLVEVTNKDNTNFSVGDFTIQLLNTAPASTDEKNSGGLAYGENKNSIVELVKYKKYSIFLAADMEMEDEGRIIKKVGQVDILKMGHLLDTLLLF